MGENYNEEYKKYTNADLDDISNKYTKEYNEESFFGKIKKYGKKIGVTPIYLSFLLFHSVKSKEIPLYMKAPLFGALGYFVSFIDIVPDLAPFVGYCDDVGVIVSSLLLISTQITYTIRQDAKESTRKIFPDVTDEEFLVIDSMYDKTIKNIKTAKDVRDYRFDTRSPEVEIIDPGYDDYKIYNKRKS